ncbi:YafY family protein [Psychrobium sp. 1_MG-2023]|uniref:helix-turn-helix transcriptional regulator n=1 Tax=Psychrobium sp. 1_MG-2023 TaxID=3062624 RepID=UPI000C33B25B|nr:YafY family protein [Psychrobium sp. 1_MG-2023]MDP2561606.1 YafY family protein [Psychrobium sp. 1_MG-2023]PKF55625.1 DNA-binding transcriptional regulator [Alteromonadales bacterium alter-6D02]
MRRADRLFQIIQLLKNRRLTTASLLAEVLEVSTRTIYRDIQDLIANGIPVEGEAGVGYLLREEVDVPPLMFNEQELESIQVGLRMVEAWAGSELASAAKQAMIKVSAVLPQELQSFNSLMFAPDFYSESLEFKHLDGLRRATKKRHYITINYTDAKENQTQRRVRPLAIHLWRGAWTLLTWCELRHDFRNFRIDRIIDFVTSEATFSHTPGQELADFIEYIQQHYK